MATNYEQAGIEAVNRLFKPMAAGMAAQQGLQRRAGEMALRRQTQLDDASTLRDQQLTDAATLREQKLTDADTLRTQQLADQETAQQNRLEQITTELSERDKINDQNLKEERDRLFAEKKDEVAGSIDFLDKNGIATGYTITDVNTMSQGRLSVAAREINREVEAFNLRKKDQGQLSDELGALARKPENYEVFKEILDLQDTDSKVIDASSFKEFSKATLIDMLSEARDKIKIRKFGPNMIPEYKSLKKKQYKLMEDTGLLDDITNPAGVRSALGTQGAMEAAKAIAEDTQFIVALTAAGMSENDQRAVINNLALGKLAEAARMLDDEGELGNTPLVDALTRWSDAGKTAAAVRVQDKLFRAQGASSKLRAINDQLRGMVQRHPWLEQAVDMTDIFPSEEFDRIANRQRQGGQGGGATTTATMTPLGPVETTGAGGAATDGGLDITAVNKALNLQGDEAAGLENVEVEGGLPSQQRQETADKVLGEGYGGFLGARYLKPGAGTWPNMGPFGDNKTLTPDQKVIEATNKIIGDIRDLKVKLNQIGATKNQGKITIKKNIGGYNLGDAGSYTTQRDLTDSELKERGVQADKLFKQLETAEEQLKILQSPERQPGL